MSMNTIEIYFQTWNDAQYVLSEKDYIELIDLVNETYDLVISTDVADLDASLDAVWNVLSSLHGRELGRVAKWLEDRRQVFSTQMVGGVVQDMRLVTHKAVGRSA